jgi:hypothetical protein
VIGWNGLPVHLPGQQHVPCLAQGLVNGDGGSIRRACHVCVKAYQVDVLHGGVTRLQPCRMEMQMG